MALKYKITIAFGLLLTLIVAGFWLALKLQLQQSLKQQTETIGLILAKQMSGSVTELVLANDVLGLNVVVNQLVQEPGITRAAISDVDGIVLASAARDGMAPANTATTYQAAITLQGLVAGQVQLSLDENLLRTPLTQPQVAFYGAIIGGLVITLILAFWLAAGVSRPLRELLHDIDHPEEDETPRLPASGEVGQVQQRVYELLHRQVELEEQLSNAGLPDPADDEAVPSSARRRLATLLVVSVKDSQRVVELLNAATLALLLQQFQFYLRQAARLYRGVVTRIDGDSILVCFDARRCKEDHAFNALCCAQLFMLLMQKTTEKQRDRNAQSLEFNIAVHSGEVFFSPLWAKQSKDGEAQQESAIGKAVDMAHALLQQTTPGQLTVTAFSYQLAGGQTRFPSDSTRMLRVQFGNEDYSTYRLDAHSGSHTELLQRQCQHMIPDTAPAAQPEA
ncbi:MAG: hypothetical protein LBE21_08170 [Pseudomonadales bacterium]|jgi:class 3 adenylate cyclase/uncharacterized membrane protein affecting hemolysin expression|nr:hypothetical protein [Pseudomonadales bacterium]